jgi:hypothetical protein
MQAGSATGLVLAGLAAFAWLGLELLIGASTGSKQMDALQTSLSTKIEQL